MTRTRLFKRCQHISENDDEIYNVYIKFLRHRLIPIARKMISRQLQRTTDESHGFVFRHRFFDIERSLMNLENRRYFL